MSEDGKELSPEEKLWAVKEYLSGKGLGVDFVNTQRPLTNLFSSFGDA